MLRSLRTSLEGKMLLKRVLKAMSLGRAFENFEKYYSVWNSNAAHRPTELLKIIPLNAPHGPVNAQMIENAINHIHQFLSDNVLKDSLYDLVSKVRPGYDKFTSSDHVDRKLYNTCVREMRRGAPWTTQQQLYHICEACAELYVEIENRRIPLPEQIRDFYIICMHILLFIHDPGMPRLS